jgi:hypothetical protein
MIAPMNEEQLRLQQLTLEQLHAAERRQRELGRRHHYLAEVMYWGAVLSSAVASICAATSAPTWLMASMAILPATFTAGGRNAFHRERSNWHYLYLNELEETRHRVEEARTEDQLLQARLQRDRIASIRERQFPRPKEAIREHRD